MSISGISSIDLTSLTTQNSWQAMQKAGQKLGQDLQSGDLSAAQTDFTTLMKDLPASAASSTTPIGKAYAQLGQDLQSGNLTAAQQDYATLQQDVQSQSSTQPTTHHHHHHGGGGSAISQLLNANSPVLQAYLGASSSTSEAASTLSVTA